MNGAYSILDLSFCHKWWRLVPRSKICFTQPNELCRNECKRVFPSLNHQFFAKLEPGLEPSDAFLGSVVE